MNIGEAHKNFVSEYPLIKVSLSKFFTLRPKYVLPVKCTPHNVCVCKSYANMDFLLKSIQSEALLPNTTKDLLMKTCCDISNGDCSYGNCGNCVNDLMSMVPNDIDLSRNVKWKSWELSKGVLTVVEKESQSSLFVLHKINSHLLDFIKHCFVKTQQEKYFENKKKEIANNEAVVQCDFAENYSLVNQDEIQSAHWKHAQVNYKIYLLYYIFL